MNIVVVSHSCVVDVNQQLLQSLCQLEDVRLLLISPANWISDVTKQPMIPQDLVGAKFATIRRKVALPGNINMHFYIDFPSKEIRDFSPDVIYSTQEPYSLSNYQIFALARKLNVPFVFHTNQNIRKSYPPPFSWLESQSFQHADAALAFSREALDVMVSKGRRGDTAVVPYATDISRFAPSPEEKRAVRQEYSISDDDIVFGFIGRFVTEKGLADLLDAAARIKDINPELSGRIKLLLVGSGDAESALRDQGERLGITDSMLFTGVVPHRLASRYLNAMDVFVLPSRTMPNWKEQFGRVIVEAMACGVPVIGSDSGEIPNLIKATQGGVVFKESDPESLAENMVNLALDPSLRGSLGETGAASVKDNYSVDAVALKLRQIFEKSISSHHEKKR